MDIHIQPTDKLEHLTPSGRSQTIERIRESKIHFSYFWTADGSLHIEVDGFGFKRFPAIATIANIDEYILWIKEAQAKISTEVEVAGRKGFMTNTTTDTRPDDSFAATGSPVLGTGFYRDAKPGTFGRSEWLDLLMAVQDGRATCMRGLEIIEREMDAQLENPPRHVYWGAGEPDCPRDIKAPNGELHTLKCKVCGLENPRDSACRASLANA